ncbi:hypothetical protein SAMN05877831_11939 [Rhodobacter maris]|uniref:Transposase n=1 Tax=Rhodobacter maris TaxID=446682 RepID=A0A285TEC9_9RHOB|nr:hypothetical protein SAMN05877831_11939 [Rhodobacter maris]
MIFRLRDLLVGQRTQTINALRGHLAEFGLVAGKGRENIDKLRAALEPGQDATKDLPPSFPNHTGSLGLMTGGC